METDIRFFVSNPIIHIGKMYFIMMFKLYQKDFYRYLKCKVLEITEPLNRNNFLKNIDIFELEISEDCDYNFNQLKILALERYDYDLFRKNLESLIKLGVKFDANLFEMKLTERKIDNIFPFVFDKETNEWIMKNSNSELQKLLYKTSLINFRKADDLTIKRELLTPIAGDYMKERRKPDVSRQHKVD